MRIPNSACKEAFKFEGSRSPWAIRDVSRVTGVVSLGRYRLAVLKVSLIICLSDPGIENSRPHGISSPRRSWIFARHSWWEV